MSYRAFKRLLGETSLERKCRFLFGVFTLALLFGSFWFYAYQTKELAYDQLKAASRPLANQTVDRHIATVCRPPGTPLSKGRENPDIANARKEWENNGPDALQEHRWLITL